MFYTPATTWSQMLKTSEIQPAEVIDVYQKRAESIEKKIQGYLLRFDTPVRSAPGQSDFQDIPLVLKDNICLADHLTTCGSRILGNFIPPYQATVSQKLLAAGIPILGKANMDEFAMGSSNENSAFHTTMNPWDLTRVPGGSSGGSAALVAAGAAPWALGSDTGGSIRQPAAFCGVVGMKPTYGRVSRFGLVAYASSLDQIGPLTLTVRDNAHLLNLIAGHDPADSTSLKLPPEDFSRDLGKDIRGVRIGVPREMLAEGVDPEVRAAIEKALGVFESQGAVVAETSLPRLKYALAAYYLIATSEASSNLARFDGVRYGHRAQMANNLVEMYTQSRNEGFGSEVKRRIMLGTYALSSGYYDAYYKKAQQVRTLLIQDFQAQFAQFDFLISPTSPITAFRLGEKQADPLSMYLTDILTVPVNLVGIPALSLPCGFDRQNLPIGLQIMAKPLAEAAIYQLAQAYESATTWHTSHPEL
ncbi:MAG: Asp-tRNA(Asn)/Glu-tRNA(Gln) amidotransferase subunit GatA [Candidatus Sericytochromatia bacterium]